MTLRSRRAQCAPDPGNGQYRADAHHGVGRRQQHHVGGFDGLGDSWARRGRLGADESEAVGRHLRAVAHPPLLEVDGPLLPVIRIADDDVGLAAVVAGRQQPGAGGPPIAQRLGHLRERIACAQHLAAHEMGGQISIAKAEPIRLHAVCREFLFGMPGFVAMTPATLGVDAATQGVHAGVEIRADPHAVHPGVVADVDDRGEFVIGGFCGELAPPGLAAEAAETQ